MNHVVSPRILFRCREGELQSTGLQAMNDSLAFRIKLINFFFVPDDQVSPRPQILFALSLD